MVTVAKMGNQLVEIIRVADAVAFSSQRGWIMICTDWQQSNRRKQQFKWIPASTRFEWVRDYNFEANV